MGIKFTDEQVRAINCRDGSMIVTAAAGSGKTAVICERILRIIENTDIDRLIIATFTNAAAAQMRDKISKALNEAIEDDETDDEKRARYRKQLLYLPDADICTVHSLCLKIIRENFDKANLPCSFAILEENVKKLVFEESVKEVVEEGYLCEDFLSLSKKYATSKQNYAEFYIRNLYSASQNMPYPSVWLDMVLNSYEDFENSVWFKEMYERTCGKLKDALEIYSANIDMAYSETETYREALIKMRNNDIESVYAILDNAENYEGLYDLLCTVKFSPMPRGLKTESERIDKARNSLKTAVKDIVTKFSYFAIKELMSVQKEDIKVLIKYTKRLAEVFFEKKIKAGGIDFNDIEHIAINLLTDEKQAPTALAKEYSKKYDYIIIDEYQDTNNVQEIIFKAISAGKDNMFMVGDMKQSIYSFRNTAPEIFLNKAELYSKPGSGERVALTNNFRSRRNILNFSNFVFSQIMSKRAGEIEYFGDEVLNKGASYNDEEDEPVEVVFVKSSDEIADVTGQAVLCAEKISDIIENTMITDIKSGMKRKAKYSDICIISRKSKGVFTELCNTLALKGVPNVCDDTNEAFFESYEIKFIMSYLSIIDNPYQDIPFAAVMRGPVYCIDDDCLAKISRCGKKTDSFYEKTRKYAANDGKVSKFLRDLEMFSSRSKYEKCGQLIGEILSETGFYDFATNMKGWEQRKINLDSLIRYAEGYESAALKGIGSFVSYVNNLNTVKGGIGAPAYRPEGMDCVTVTTIHKSKGLEFPVVILIGMENQFNFQSLNSYILCDKNLGAGFTYIDDTKGIKMPSPVTNIIKEIKRNREVSEEMRILYVALTRAKEKLVLVGTADEKTFEKADRAACADGDRLPPEMVMGAKSYMDFIVMALSRYEKFPQEYLKFTGTAVVKTDAKIKFTRFGNAELKNADSLQSGVCDIDFDGIETSKAAVGIFSEENEESGGRYIKYSVSDLKKDGDEEINPYFEKLLPMFEEDGNEAAERGTDIHKAFYVIDCKNTATAEDVRNQIEEKLGIEAASSLPVEEIFEFYKTDMARNMANSEHIYKESPFIIQDSGILVQGVIDCYFEKDGKYVILDYKSDNLTEKNREERIKMYGRQLSYYKKAVKKIHKTDNVEAYIYFIRNREFVKYSNI